MITLNQPIKIADTQTFSIAKIDIDFEQGTITVLTNIKNENGQLVSTLKDTYSGQEAIDYWANFNSKQYAYEKMVEQNSIEVLVENIPDTLVETDGE